ncbi:MAG: DUF6625 family protein, partial [Cetobacterium sp.]
MKKIIIILPYFGKFPNYFSLWLKSVELNPNIDFLLITDNEFNYELPKNIKIITRKFEELKAEIQKCFDFEIILNSPYKICDYRPAFGFIFKEHINGYDFWGHCDADMIFGDLKKFLSDEILEKNYKIYTKGHLSLYRNIDLMNTLFKNTKTKHYYKYFEVFKTSYPCHFDEDGTINYLCKDIEIYNGFDYADVSPKNFT